MYGGSAAEFNIGKKIVHVNLPKESPHVYPVALNKTTNHKLEMRTILITKSINICTGVIKENVQNEILFNSRVTVVFKQMKLNKLQDKLITYFNDSDFH